MRVGLIADIHGNLVSLDAVLADLERAQVDHVVCLGDVAWGPQPRQTVERLRALSYPPPPLSYPPPPGLRPGVLRTVAAIMGNADDELFNLPSETPADDNARATLDIARWCAAQLSPADLNYLRTFHPILELSLGAAHTLLCFHGSPRSFHDIIRSTTAEDNLAGMLAGFSATVMAGGHTHEQMLRRYRETIIVNPGSVGLPFERGPGADQVRNPPWAEYALVSRESGILRIELRRVPIDVGAIVRAIRESGMPHADLYAQDWR
jgi:predicted phosphodiesterase